MYLFLRLYLAHLIADFILQFDELYKLKVKSRWGHVLHVAIHFLTSVLFAAPFLKYPSVWICLTGLTAAHYFQDELKYAVQKNPKRMFVAFVTDQIVHFAVIGTVMVLPVSRLALGISDHPVLSAYYSSNPVVLLMILFVLATFAGSYLLHAFRMSYFAQVSRPDHAITRFEMIHAMIERTLIAGLFLFSPGIGWLIASPLVGIPRLFSKKLRDKTDFLFSYIYAALLGFFFRWWF
ncbi:MAG: DUF3307 domain-containing protein [Candidatus Omnitrophica bacterium]|nr:DUF3307 domain-containing protein [Candidatus Omnitrophota bacterium]MDD5671588.1 DUF3307 domain-containing protein [Candidatus Omnitrophota bacterium]